MSQFTQVFNIVNDLPSPLDFIIWLLLGAGSLGFLIWKSFKFIQPDEEALKKRWGRIIFKGDNGDEPVTAGPGPLALVPGAHSIERVNRLDKTILLDDVRIEYGQYHVVDVDALVTLSVKNVYRVRYVAQELGERVRGICKNALGLALQDVPDGQIYAHHERVLQAFRSTTRQGLDELGLELKDLNFLRIARNEQFAIAESIAQLGPETVTLLKELGIIGKDQPL